MPAINVNYTAGRMGASDFYPARNERSLRKSPAAILRRKALSARRGPEV